MDNAPLFPGLKRNNSPIIRDPCCFYKRGENAGGAEYAGNARGISDGYNDVSSSVTSLSILLHYPHGLSHSIYQTIYQYDIGTLGRKTTGIGKTTAISL